MTYTATLTNTVVTTYTYNLANRLQTATNLELGSSSYLYDNNGNLELTIPPNGTWLHYGYDQRNLMISHTTSLSGTNPQLIVAYSYDGAGNRVQQVDSAGTTPITTTYINDVVGLTQVLVADDGTTQVHNLFGLDLIGQDESVNMRYLLADGLGSVRTEIANDAVESITTYDPFGNLLTQTGSSSTTYGYSGEQFDNATNLLYLRARYYNPALRAFMGKDPWSGNVGSPQSMNGWSYVENNSINLADPTGAIPALPEPLFPDFCHTATDKTAYILCVTQAFDLDADEIKLLRYKFLGTTDDKHYDIAIERISGVSGCYYGPVPYRGTGYSEGVSVSLTAPQSWPWLVGGQEVVYDFATLEQGVFQFGGKSLSGTILGASGTSSTGKITGLRSWRNLGDDYSGETLLSTIGIGMNFYLELGVSYGYVGSDSLSDSKINGVSLYSTIGAGFDLVPVAEIGYAVVTYNLSREFTNNPKSYVQENGTIQFQQIAQDILMGNNTPFSYPVSHFLDPLRPLDRDGAVREAFRYAWVYQNIEFSSGK